MVNASQNPVGTHSGRYRIVPAHDDGWHVVVEDGPGVVTFTYCSDWHRVERLLAVLDRQERGPDASRQAPADPR